MQYKIKTAHSLQEVEEFREIWKDMSIHPNSDIDFYLTIIGLREEILRPHVILFTLNGIPKALIVGRIEKNTLNFRIGYKTIYRPNCLALTVVYGGVIGEDTQESSEIIYWELNKVLERKEADVIYFSHLNVNSYLCHIFRERPSFMRRDNARIDNIHWKMTLTNANVILKSKNSSRRKRYLKGLEKISRSGVHFEEHDHNSDLENLALSIESIAMKTYHRGIGAGFILNDENRRRLQLMAERSWLRAYILFINEKPCAYYIGTLYNNILYLDYTGYDPFYKKYEPGTLLLHYLIECSMRRDQVNAIDFGFGDAFYKSRYCDLSWYESCVYLYPLTFRGVFDNTIRQIIYLISSILKYILKEGHLISKIKKYWRNYLAPSTEFSKKGL